MTDLREKTPAFMFMAQLGLMAIMIYGLLWYLPDSPYRFGGQIPEWYKTQLVAAVLVLVSGLAGALVMPIAGVFHARYQIILVVVMFPSGVFGYLLVCLWQLRLVTLPYSLLNTTGFLICICSVIVYVYTVIMLMKVYLHQARLKYDAE